MDNPPQQGICSYCHCQSTRLLNPPLIEIQLTSLKIPPEIYNTNLQPGKHISWTPNCTPASHYEIIELYENTVICLAPDAVRDELYCYQCFAGHLWPALRPHVINMPPQLVFDKANPWHDPRWIDNEKPALKGAAKWTSD